MIIIIQIISILFALSCAWHDGPAVTRFENAGIDADGMKKFHRYNGWLKFLFSLACALVFQHNIRLSVLVLLLSATWVYLLFDPALNLVRLPKRKWDYLGISNFSDRFWRSMGGGRIKAAILLAIITCLNFLYYGNSILIR